MNNKYPEHEKLSEVKEQSQFLGEFLDYCRENNINPLKGSIQQMLAAFFQIDLRKLEDEKDEMLEEIRKLNQE